MASCRRILAEILTLFNFALGSAGLGMAGYGVYMLVQWMENSGGGGLSPSPAPTPAPLAVASVGLFRLLRRRWVAALAVSDGLLEQISKAWFIYLFIGVGVIIFIIALFGCVGILAKKRWCIYFYSSLVFLLVLIEVGSAAAILYDRNWKNTIPGDRTHNFDIIYAFLNKNWEIVRWVAVGLLIFEVLLFVLSLTIAALHKRAVYSIADPRASTREPLLQSATATGVPVPFEERQARDEAKTWGQKIKKKYGLDSPDYAYRLGLADPIRSQQDADVSHHGRCSIL